MIRVDLPLFGFLHSDPFHLRYSIPRYRKRRPHTPAAEAMKRIARALGAMSAAGGLFDLAEKTGAPLALRDIGMPEDGLDRAADLAAADPYWNPRPIDRAATRALLDDAWDGRRPAAE
jgi:alcohol dehydrogenase class IV